MPKGQPRSITDNSAPVIRTDVRARHRKAGRPIFQAGHAGSIPLIRSMNFLVNEVFRICIRSDADTLYLVSTVAFSCHDLARQARNSLVVTGRCSTRPAASFSQIFYLPRHMKPAMNHRIPCTVACPQAWLETGGPASPAGHAGSIRSEDAAAHRTLATATPCIRPEHGSSSRAPTPPRSSGSTSCSRPRADRANAVPGSRIKQPVPTPARKEAKIMTTSPAYDSSPACSSRGQIFAGSTATGREPRPRRRPGTRPTATSAPGSPVPRRPAG